MTLERRQALVVVWGLTLVACTRRSASTAQDEPQATVTTATPTQTAPIDATAKTIVDASAETIDASTEAIVDAGLESLRATVESANALGEEPQTHARPKDTGESLDGRARALWDAIVSDEPERAMTFFFPVTAYKQVKAVASPESDWKRRLVAAFARDVHALHERLGKTPEKARFVGLDVPNRARWVEPNEEYNRLGYYRVYGSRLRYERDGKPQTFDVTSLISWRGEWFVVHLSGFK